MKGGDRLCDDKVYVRLSVLADVHWDGGRRVNDREGIYCQEEN